MDLSGEEEKGPPDTLTNTLTETQSSAYHTAFHATAMDTVAMTMIKVQYTVNVCIRAVTISDFHYTIIIAKRIHDKDIIVIFWNKKNNAIKFTCFVLATSIKMQHLLCWSVNQIKQLQYYHTCNITIVLQNNFTF